MSSGSNPTNPSAVVTRSLILLQAKEHSQAAAILHKAIELTASEKKEKPPAVFYLMLAAVENETPPSTDALKRAGKVLDSGLEAHPMAFELVQAKYLALVAGGDPAAALAFVEAKAKEDPKGPFRRLLVEKYREQKQLERAERLLSELHKEFPDESQPGGGARPGRVARGRRGRRAEPGRPPAPVQWPGDVHDPRFPGPLSQRRGLPPGRV